MEPKQHQRFYPPNDLPPITKRREQRSIHFRFKPAFVGLLVGIVLAALVIAVGGSSLWVLFVPLGFLVGGFATSGSPPILW